MLVRPQALICTIKSAIFNLFHATLAYAHSLGPLTSKLCRSYRHSYATTHSRLRSKRANRRIRKVRTVVGWLPQMQHNILPIWTGKVSRNRWHGQRPANWSAPSAALAWTYYKSRWNKRIIFASAASELTKVNIDRDDWLHRQGKTDEDLIIG